MQGNEHFKQLQQQVSSGLKQGLKRLRSKMSSLQQQMGSTEESQQIQKQADLLTANIYRYHYICAADSCAGCLHLLFSGYVELSELSDLLHGKCVSLMPFLASAMLCDSNTARCCHSADCCGSAVCQFVVTLTLTSYVLGLDGKPTHRLHQYSPGEHCDSVIHSQVKERVTYSIADLSVW